MASAGRHDGSVVVATAPDGTARPEAGASTATPVGWLWFLAAATLAAAAYYWLPRTGLLPSWILEVGLYKGLAVASVVAIVVGVRRHNPASRSAWWLAATGVAAFLIGDIAFYVQQDVLGLMLFPSVADLFYLLSYPFEVAGLILLIHRRDRGLDRAGLLDALILVTGLALVTWGYVIVPRIQSPGVPVIERLVLVSYPIMDLLVLAAAIRLTFGRAAARRRSGCSRRGSGRLS